MTNKNILIVILFFLTLACSTDNDVTQNDSVNGELIRIGGTITNIATKAIIDNTAFPDNSQVGIFGWGHHKDNPASPVIRKDLNNSPYSKTAGSNDFTTTIEAHYPINPDTLLNFYAYYPYVEAATATPSSIPFDLKKQDDIMWATPILDKDKTTAGDKVNLSFNHILSAITLKFKKADDIKEDMVLESISMENYPSTLLLNVQSGVLSGQTSDSPFLIINNLQTEITKDEATIVTDYLLYPVQKPVFIVKMSGKDYRIESTRAFEKGKKQTYTFTIQASDISISGSINPWQIGEGSNETVYF